jgi:virginiamycin B lyase
MRTGCRRGGCELRARRSSRGLAAAGIALAALGCSSPRNEASADPPAADAAVPPVVIVPEADAEAPSKPDVQPIVGDASPAAPEVRASAMEGGSAEASLPPPTCLPADCPSPNGCTSAGVCAGPFSEIALPPGSASAVAITTGSDRNLWLVLGSGEIVRLTTAGVSTAFHLPAGRGFEDLTVGPDGNLWATVQPVDAIARITPAGVVTEFPVTANSRPTSIAVGPDKNLYFTQRNYNGFGKITPNGVFTQIEIESFSGYTGLAPGPDGNLWVPEAPRKISRIQPDGKVVERRILDQASSIGDLQDIVRGPDDRMWITDRNDNILCLTAGGQFTQYPARPGSSPQSLVVGPDQNIWYVGQNDNTLVRLRTAGQSTEFHMPATSTGPHDLTVGPDGALWFTFSTTGRVGRFALP